MNIKNFDFNKLRIFSGSVLKLIAIVTMFIDHIGLIILPRLDWAIEPFFTVLGSEISLYYIARKIGRLAFPIFCFLIVEGFIHTKNRKKYALSLLIFGLVSEIPFDLMISGSWFYPQKQNIYFTLLLGVVIMWVIENIDGQLKKFLCFALLYIVIAFLKVDYGFRGVLLIALLYVLRDKNALKILFAFPILSSGLAALSAFVPISMYNGERGFIKGRAMKYAFYLFYPVHILALVLISYVI